MKKKLIEHIVSIFLISAILLTLLVIYQNDKKDNGLKRDSQIELYLNLPFIDLDNPFHKELLRDALNIYYPQEKTAHDSLLQTIELWQKKQFGEDLNKAHILETLSLTKLIHILFMFLKFTVIYLTVLLLTYYGVETLAVLRFVRKKQNRVSYLEILGRHLRNFRQLSSAKELGYFIISSVSLLSKAILKGLFYILLFSPAYVIAYSLKTEFSTDSIPFMILLGLVSNGLLISYTNKFYTFLIAEGRKGYVQTALVKGLNDSWSQTGREGISYKNIFSFSKNFKDHIFGHIFINARYQYLATVKEQAAFLITSLIIIEMALNIHGHLSYELLQQILYKNYDIVIVIILAVFYLVKATEILMDLVISKAAKKYENR